MVNKFIIKNPIITEKAHDLSGLGKYVFLVKKNAVRPEIKKAIEAIYRVRVTRVNIVNLPSKRRRLGRTAGVKPGYKKAIVTLKPGQKLDVLPH